MRGLGLGWVGATGLAVAGCVVLTDDDRAGRLDEDGDGVVAAEDCDDANPAQGRPSTEICNSLDDDCDGRVDEDLFPDDDGDGFGDAAATGACFAHWVSIEGDCDDADPTAYPGAPERCDGRDNACGQGWSPASEQGQVTWVSSDGADWEDHSAAWAAGSPGAPAAIDLPTTGVLHVCRGLGSYPVRLTATDPAGLVVLGRAIPSDDDADHWDALPVLAGSDSGAEPGPVVSVSGIDAVLTLRGLRLQGGQSTALQPGGGVSVRGGERVTLRDVAVSANIAGEDAPGAAGIYTQYLARLELVDAVVEANVTAAAGQGGGLYALGTDVRMSGTAFEANEARGEGGGVFLEASRLEAWGSRFIDNEGARGGGGLHVSRGSDGLLYDTVFDENVGDLGGAARVEGNLSCFSVDATPTFLGNTARHAGAVYAVLDMGRASFDGCTVEDNAVEPGRVADAVTWPDLVVAADAGAATPARHYRISGPSWYCDEGVGCQGDVEGE